MKATSKGETLGDKMGAPHEGKGLGSRVCFVRILSCAASLIHFFLLVFIWLSVFIFILVGLGGHGGGKCLKLGG